MSQPLETALPRLQQQQLHSAGLSPSTPMIYCWNTFYLHFITASGNTLYQAFVYLSQRLRMTHQKRTIRPYVCAAADYTVLYPVGNAWRYSLF